MRNAEYADRRAAGMTWVGNKRGILMIIVRSSRCTDVIKGLSECIVLSSINIIIVVIIRLRGWMCHLL